MCIRDRLNRPILGKWSKFLRQTVANTYSFFCGMCAWTWSNSFRSRPIPIEEKANATRSFSYSVAIVIDYPLLPVKDVGCNWLNRVFVFHCCRDHFFYKFRNQVIFASCSQRFPITNNFIIVLDDRIWFKFYTFSQDGVSVGMLLGDCWQYLLYRIDDCVYIIIFLGFLVEQKPNSR